MRKKLPLFLLIISFYTLDTFSQDSAYKSFRKRLDNIVSENFAQQSNYYHFARLYQRFSDEVRVLSNSGKLNDSDFTHKLEGRFGYYFIKNYDSLANGNFAAYAWQKAFDTSNHPNKYASSLILSINAHVSHDLLFALYDVFKTYSPTRKRKKDYILVAKLHHKIIKDYFENILPYVDANKKWERQTLRRLSRQVGHILKLERNRIWRKAKRGLRKPNKLESYFNKQVINSVKRTNFLLQPKGLVKKGFLIADKLDALSFAKRVFLINNKRP